ncbi:hypothetical protein CHUAL_002177 [Chamberlinius hualienensis]
MPTTVNFIRHSTNSHREVQHHQTEKIFIGVLFVFTLINIYIHFFFSSSSVVEKRVADALKPRITYAFNGTFCRSSIALASINQSNGFKNRSTLKPQSLQLLKNLGRYDNSRKYAIHDFVYVGRQWYNVSHKAQVTLATQTSVENLFRLVEISQSWLGLVSVSVFVPGEDYNIAQFYIQLLNDCFESIRMNVSFHFVYPVDKPPDEMPGFERWIISCSKWKTIMKDLLSYRSREMLNWREQLLYPQNHMRNVARKACYTPYVFVTDIELIPKFSLATELDTFLLNKPCTRCAFVVPTYEVGEYMYHLPANKSELLRLINKQVIQPFHVKTAKRNQRATNSSLWESLPETDTISVAYLITKFQTFYEPFYVAEDDVPPHDERFVGYGYTRNSQVFRRLHLTVYTNGAKLE